MNKLTIQYNLGEKREQREFTFDVPKVQDLLKSSKLTKKQQSSLLLAFKEEVKTSKAHFKDGAWPLDVEGVVAEIMLKVLGFETFMLKAALAANSGTSLSLSFKNGMTMTNTVDKVFFNLKSNKIYVAKSAKDADFDVQLGDL